MCLFESNKNVNILTSVCPQAYLSLFFIIRRSMFCEVYHRRAELLVAVEAFQQRHAELLRVRVRVRVWRALVVTGLDLVVGGSGLDEALNLCHAIGAHHSVGLDHRHS